METKEINNILIQILDLIQSDGNKVELLMKAKSIKRLLPNARKEAKELDEDSMDEISLEFGDKFFELLKG